MFLSPAPRPRTRDGAPAAAAHPGTCSPHAAGGLGRAGAAGNRRDARPEQGEAPAVPAPFPSGTSPGGGAERGGGGGSRECGAGWAGPGVGLGRPVRPI